MKHLKALIKIIFTTVVVYGVIITNAQSAENDLSYRDSLPVSPVEILGSTFKYLKAGDTQKAKKSIDVIKDLISANDKLYGQNLLNDLNDALAAEDLKTATAMLVRLTYYDVKNLLNAGIAEFKSNPEKGKIRLKAAYIEYTIIMPYLEKENFNDAGLINKLFKNMNMFLTRTDTSGYTYSREKSDQQDPLASDLEALVKKIESLLDKLMVKLK